MEGGIGSVHRPDGERVAGHFDKAVAAEVVQVEQEVLAREVFLQVSKA